MLQDCLSADHSSACLGSLGGPSKPWSSGSYHPCLASGLGSQRPVTFPPLRKGVPSPEECPVVPASIARGKSQAEETGEPTETAQKPKGGRTKGTSDQSLTRSGYPPEKTLGRQSWPTRPDTRVPHERVITKEMRSIASCPEGQKDAVRQAFQSPRSTYATCSAPMNSSSEEPSQG